MEIFVGIKTDLRRMGCLLFDHPRKKLINTVQHFFFYSIMFSYFIDPLWFFLTEAKTFNEYVESLTPCISGFLDSMMYSTLLWNRDELLEMMAEFGSIIQSRKFENQIFPLY